MATYTNKNGTDANDVLTYDKNASSTVIYHANGGNDTVNITGGKVTVQLDKGSNTVNVTGGSGHVIKIADTDAASDAINGNDNLTIKGGNGVSANLGSGKDSVTISNSDGRFNGASSQIHGGAWGDTFTVEAGAKNYQLYGDAGDDTFNVNGGVNINVWGGSNNDTFTVKDGSNNKLYGGNGNDLFEIYANDQNMTLGYGNDTVNIYEGDNQTIAANLGINEINLLAGSGHTIVADFDKAASAEAGKEIGYGQDTVNVNGATNVTMSLGDGRDTVNLSSGSNHNIDAGGWTDTINITGDVSDSTINAGDGNDIINVNGGANNLIQGGAGADAITVDWEKVGEGNVIDQTSASAYDKDTLQIQNVNSTAFDFAMAGDNMTLTDKENGKTMEITGFGKGLDSITFDDRTMAGYDFYKEIILDGGTYGAVALGGYSPNDPTDFAITFLDGVSNSLTAFKDERQEEESELAELSAFGNIVTIEKDGCVQANEDTDDDGDVKAVELLKGQANGNSVIINGANVAGDVYGADVISGTANANIVRVTGGSVDGVAGGVVDSGQACDNKVYVTDASASLITGGVSGKDGVASENLVRVENAAVGCVIGAMSGTDEEEAEVLVEGHAQNNSVSVTNSTVEENVVGAISLTGNVGANEVTLVNTSVGNGEEDSGSVYGAKVGGQGQAISNSVTMTGGAAVSVIGGEAEAGSAYNNTVTVTGAAISGNVIGGKSETGLARNNTVNIGAETVVEGNVMANASAKGSVGAGTVNTSGTVKGAVLGGEGVDTVTVAAGYVKTIDLGAGADNITVSGGEITEIVDGAGDDNITITGGTVWKVALADGANTVAIDGEDAVVKNISGSATGSNTVAMGAGVATLTNAPDMPEKLKVAFDRVSFAGKGGEITLNNVDAKDVSGVVRVITGGDQNSTVEDKLNLVNSNITMTSGQLKGIAVNGGYNEITMNGGNTVIAVNNGMANVKVNKNASLGWIGSTSTDNTLLTVDGGNVWSGNLGATGDLVTVKNGGFVNMDFGAGADTLDLQNGTAENIVMGDGDDNAIVHIGSIKNLSMGAGNDVVTIDKWGDTCKVENVDLGSGNNTVNIAWGEAGNVIGGEGKDTINMQGGSVGIGEGSIETINVGQLYNTITINGGTVGAINAVELDKEEKNSNAIVMNGGSVTLANGYMKSISVNKGASNTISIAETAKAKEIYVNTSDSTVNIDVTNAAAIDVINGKTASLTMYGEKNAVGIKSATVEALVVDKDSMQNKVDLVAGNITLAAGKADKNNYLGQVNMYSWGTDQFHNTITIKENSTINQLYCQWYDTDTNGQIEADITIEAGGKLNSANLGNGKNTVNVIGGTVSNVNFGTGDDELTIKAGSDGDVASTGSFYMGDGNDKVTVDAYGYIGSINLGAGNDTFEMGLTQAPWWNTVDSLAVGAGNDTVTIKSGNVNYLALESGTNTINVNGGTITKVACFTDVTNTINLAGGTIEEMTAGKADTINMNGGAITIVGGYGVVNEVLSINVKSGEENAITLTNAKAKQIIAEGDAAVQLTLENTKEGVYENITKVTLGAGADTINIKGFGGEPLITGEFSTGAGNDTLVVEDTNISAVNMGDGNNEFSILSGGVSNLTLGDGDNTVNGGSGLSNIVAGDGNNTINLLPNKFGGYTNSVKLGNGDNIINVGDGYGVMSIETGNGNNTVTVSRDATQNTAMLISLKTGSGNDTVNYNSIGTMQTIDVGAGDDTVVMHSPYFKNGDGITINLGEGNDSMSLLSDGKYTVNGGAGSDTFIVDWSKEFDITINEVAQSGYTNTLELTNSSKYVAIIRNSSSWYSLTTNGNKQYLSVDGMNAMSSVTAAGTTYSTADIEATFAKLQTAQIYFADVDAYLAEQSSVDANEAEKITFMVAGNGK